MKRNLFSNFGVIFFPWLVCLMVVSCGWHLRGDTVISPQLKLIAIEANHTDNHFKKILRQNLVSAGAVVVDLREDSLSTIKVIKVSSRRRLVSVDDSGNATAYQLINSVAFSLVDKFGKELVLPQSITKSRNYQYDSNNVLGKAKEERSIRELLLNDIALLVMKRLSAQIDNPPKNQVQDN